MTETNLSSQIKLDQVSKRYLRPASEIELISLTRHEKVYTKVVGQSDEGAADAASDVAHTIERCVREKGRCVIGFGAGRCAIDVYDELVKLYFADKVSFEGVEAFNLGELGLGVMEDDRPSTFRRLNDALFKKVEMEPGQLHNFSQEATKENVFSLCKAYESEINALGGLDLVICELTKSGGLVFNEPGSTSMSSCRLVSLSGDTRLRIAESYQCDTAPHTAVTLGISNILKARKIIAVAWGENSEHAVRMTVEGDISEIYPASFLQMHQNVKLIVDLEAAGLLTRISIPWKVASCEWNGTLLRRALVWLCEQTGKPVLKLTDKDYNEYGLSELLALYGSAYEVNIKIFNNLQHTITGWPGGKPNAEDTYRPERAWPYPKRVLVFSPHPDDAVVSMGGTLQRLVQQKHEVHVAFETSGDVAVSDEDLMRYVMVSERFSSHYGIEENGQKLMSRAARDNFAAKANGENDSPEARFLKGQILTCEGVNSCTYMGVKEENIHELRLPFYTDEPHGQGRISQSDIDIVRDVIEQVKPHQIFFAFDLNDPYGTHERATNAVLAAIDSLQNEPFMRDCRMWMYRGQWGDWSIDHIQMAVPMSPEEFHYKGNAILKHQSQTHGTLYGATEEPMSWQRSLERNLALARQYSALGLASYEAIEAFVEYKK